MPSNYEEIRRQNIEEYGKGTDHLAYLSDLYPIRTHFLYELLQNAEDALGKRIPPDSEGVVAFHLRPDRLELRHNGKPFDEADVKGVCGIKKGTKASDYSQIGKFGIGFKSVYAYTLAPQIHCDTEHFEIQRFVEPHALPPEAFPIDIDREETCIVLPFDQPGPPNQFRKRIPPERAAAEILVGLKALGPRSLLFLKFTNEIRWSQEGGKSGHFLREVRPVPDRPAARYVDVTDGEVAETWIVFEREFPICDEDNIGEEIVEEVPAHPVVIEVAFQIANGKVVPARNTELVVAFPTAKKTELGFLIQGPFKTTKARDNIAQDSNANRQMIEAAAKLAADSLEDLRDFGLLSLDSYNALPLKASTFDDEGTHFFKPVYDAIREALRTKPLLPRRARRGRRFVVASQARLARGAQLTEVFSPRQLGRLFGDEPLYWLDTNITVDRMPELRAYLTGVRGWPDWKQEPLIEGVEIEPSQVAKRLSREFFARQSQRWLSCFYQYVAANYSAFKATPFLRIANGTHVTPGTEDKPNAYLPPRQAIGDTTGEFPQILASLASIPAVHAFLRETVKLREPDRVDVIIRCILPRYSGEIIDVDPESLEYKADLKSIVEAYQDNRASGEDRRRLLDALKSAWFVAVRSAGNGPDKSAWCQPEEEYLFHPTDELQAWFFRNSNDEAWFPLYAVDQLIGDIFLAKARRKVTSLLSVDLQRGWRGKRCAYVWPKFGFDPDADLYGVASVTAKPSEETAQRLWQLLLERPQLIKGKWLSCSNQQFTVRMTTDKQGASPMGLQVIQNRWLPRKGDAGYHTPSDLYLSDLPDDFETDTDRAQTLARTLGMKLPLDLAPVAAVLGMTQEQLETRRQLTDEEVEEILRRREPAHEFPERRSPSAERRERVKAGARSAPPITTSQQTGAVTDDYSFDKERAKTYLREQYRSDGVIFCQLSHEPMPFKVRSGDDWYFEAVKCVPDVQKAYPENYLALSPHFSAMFQYANHDRERLRELVLSASGTEIQIRLADSTYSLRFTSQHLEELKAVLEVDAESAEGTELEDE